MATKMNHSRYRLTFAPITQADFVGGFSLTSLTIFSAAALWKNPEILPPKSFYLLLAVSYLSLWGSFYIPHIRRIRGLVQDKTNLLIWMLRNQGNENIELIPPERLPRFWTAPRYARTADTRWPRHMAVRVQLLALAAIVLSAWFTCYSGGPFQSPFAQILLALPLMSPNIASDPRSVLGVYLTTTVVAILFEFFGPASESAGLNAAWYISTTGVVLIISGFVSTVTKKASYQAEPEFRDLIALAKKFRAQGHAFSLKGAETSINRPEVNAAILEIVQLSIAELVEALEIEIEPSASALSVRVEISRSVEEIEVSVESNLSSPGWVPSPIIRRRRASVNRRVKRLDGDLERSLDDSGYRLYALLPDRA